MCMGKCLGKVKCVWGRCDVLGEVEISLKKIEMCMGKVEMCLVVVDMGPAVLEMGLAVFEMGLVEFYVCTLLQTAKFTTKAI